MSEEEKNFLENMKNILSDLEDTEDGAIISLNQEEIDNLKLIPKLIEKQQKFKEDVVNLIMLWDKKELPENDRVIECLDTIMSEVSRLEDIEDREIQVAVKFVEEKRDKYWKDKIREKIKEKQDKIDKLHPASDMVIIDDLENQINCYKELIEE